MRITWKGRDLGEWRGMPNLQEARRIKTDLGLLPAEFNDAIERMDPDALCELVALLFTRAGTPTRLDEVDGEFDDFGFTLSDEEKAALSDDERKALDDWGKDSSPNGELASSTGNGDTSTTSKARSIETQPVSGDTSVSPS
jgi:hypothetical protein